MKLLQLVPSLPPPPGGVGDYALALAGALGEQARIDSLFLVATGEGAAVLERDPGALAAQLSRLGGGDVTIILHYAGYGYAPRGAPGWLPAGLERWLAGGSGRRLLTFFHEVYASGPPWRSSFWLHPFQRRVARRLLAASAHAFTSLPLYGELLAGLGNDRPVTVLPVFSTVGEPATVPPLAEREPLLVVFGGTGARERAYGRFAGDLAAACRRLGITGILDIGPPLARLPEAVAGVPVRGLGALPAATVSRHLLAARAGFLAYPPGFLAKSTIHAAYAAHGVVPVVVWEEGKPSPPRSPSPSRGEPWSEEPSPPQSPSPGPPPDHPGEGEAREEQIPPLRLSSDFPLSPEGWEEGRERGTEGVRALQPIADAARRGYLDHTLARQAEVFARQLR